MAAEMAGSQSIGDSPDGTTVLADKMAYSSSSSSSSSSSIYNVRKLLARLGGLPAPTGTNGNDASAEGCGGGAAASSSPTTIATCHRDSDFEQQQQQESPQMPAEFYGVTLRQLPVGHREIPRPLIRGEVMDFIVQLIENEDLPYAIMWKIASRCADNIFHQITTETERINALNTAAKRELEKVCRELDSNPALLKEWLHEEGENGENSCDGDVPSCSPSGISVNALRNARRSMEDRHVVVRDLNAIAHSLKSFPVRYEYYAVFDGHGGRDAANFCAAHLHLVIADQLAQNSDPAEAIRKAFVEVDKFYCDNANETARRAGSTAVVALIADRRTLHVAWLGDSEAVLARGGKAQPLVQPHKPSVPSEQERIAALGGEIVHMMGIHRVNGILAVSRSIGDVEYKRFVSSEADVISIELDSDCDFVVLGCDGLFDNLTPQDIIGHAYHAALSRQFNTLQVAHQLTKAAIGKGSTDNITTLVVNLRDPKKWKYEAVQFPSQPGDGLADRQPLAMPRKHVNGNDVADLSPPSEIRDLASLAGGESSPVREVAADFVQSAVEMALNKVNSSNTNDNSNNNNNDTSSNLADLETAAGPQLTECPQLSPSALPSESEQQDLREAEKGNTLSESERLNPEAPEFIPLAVSVTACPSTDEVVAPKTPTADDKIPTPAPASAVVPSVADTMPKSESRDELVYEVDREIGTAPQAAKAELVQLDDNTSPPTAAATDCPLVTEGTIGDVPPAKQLSDSEEELNSMVVHEDQPQTNIVPAVNMDVKLSELIVRDQNIHVIPEESPIEDSTSPIPQVPTANSTEEKEPTCVPDEKVQEKEPTPPKSQTDELDATEILQIADAVAGLTLEPAVVEAPAALSKEPATAVESTCSVDNELASEVIQGDLLTFIEMTSGNPVAACGDFAPVVEPRLSADTDYLFSTEAGVHEEVIVPRAQELLYDKDQPTASEASGDTMDNVPLVDSSIHMALDDGPKVVDAIEKDVSNAEAVASPEPALPSRLPEELLAKEQQDDTAGGQPDSLKLGSIQDIMEKLSPNEADDAKVEEADIHSAAPVIPDTLPEAEGVQDVDSESDNEGHEWKFVKGSETAGDGVQTTATDQPGKLSNVETAAAGVIAGVGVAIAAAVATEKVSNIKDKRSAKVTGKPTTKPSTATTTGKTSSQLSSTRGATSSAAKPSSAATSKITARAPSAPKATAQTKMADKSTGPSKTAVSRNVPTASAKVTSTAASKAAAAAKPTSTASSKTSGAAQASVRSTAKPVTTKSSAGPAGLSTKAMAPKPPVTAKAAPAKAGSSSASSKAPPTLSAGVSSKVTTASSKSNAASAMPAPASKSAATHSGIKPTAPSPKVATKTATKTAPTPARVPSSKPAATSATAKKASASSSAPPPPATNRVAAARAAAASRPTSKASAATSLSDAKPKTGPATKTSSNTKGTSASALPKSPMKKVVKRDETQKCPTKDISPVTPADGDIVAPGEGVNGTAESQPQVACSQTNGHTESVDITPADQAPENPVEL